MLEAFAAEFKRTFLLFRRYPGEAIGGIVSITAIFYGLFLGAKYIAGPGAVFGDRLEAIVVGYVVWTLVLFIYGELSWDLMNEAQTGTLEQVFLTPFGPVKLYTLRMVAGLAINLGMNVGILLIVMLLTGTRLSFPPELILPLFAVILGCFGISFLVGCLALLLKRVQQLIQLSQFALLFLVMTPVETWGEPLRSLGFLLPLTPGVGLLRDLMARDAGLEWGQLGLALANGLVYFALGLLVFQYAVGQAKRRGLLGGY